VGLGGIPIGILADVHDAVEPHEAALVRFRELGVDQVVTTVFCHHDMRKRPSICEEKDFT
jgi:hypothetical protein